MHGTEAGPTSRGRTPSCCRKAFIVQNSWRNKLKISSNARKQLEQRDKLKALDSLV